ncbi:origin recognition complex subunit 6-domain-containing protein [Lasiosphaeria miniovina]|uniref:Origin recognition complex subunit 6-domain-containing protein n=1 Tax=Lasiosphaeria miniovina TaxID=1954250 RepID=A0AA40A0D1_9PEZI|nr:origin recognition complex subunit 6-domain-containing protein [Lasiosphaeria miniovina]KAK0706976.1 origin recognition complex subunit 6-domain-containing protein [Lasiosphaeria miniovina]
MNRSIELALVSLLPTHSATLPQPLSELASSLLAQSRIRASTLKAEEEVARPYACAHIACDRLKITLNLPPIDPRPPIPPRIYRRLYNHLDKILPAVSSSSAPGTPSRTTPGKGSIRTPSSRLRQQPGPDGQASPLGSSPSRSSHRTLATATTKAATTTITKTAQTPSRSLAQFRGTPASHKRTPKATAADNLPAWVRATVRHLIAALGPPSIGPVVMAGMESIAAAAATRAARGRHARDLGTDTGGADGWVRDNLPALLGALYLYVWRAVEWAGREMDAAAYTRMRRSVAAALAEARLGSVSAGKQTAAPDEDDTKDEDEGDDDALWEGWPGPAKVSPKDLDAAALRINKQGWLELDWARGIDDLVARGEAALTEAEALAEEDENNKHEAHETLQIRRPDTMFQERYDYLSERKKRDYAVWREKVLGRIHELERSHGHGGGRTPRRDVDAMDIDE